MASREHPIPSGGGEARRETSKKVKLDKVPQRGPGIAVLEKLRSDELQKRFSVGTELIVHPVHSQTVPFLDPSSSLGYSLENFGLPLYRFLDSTSPLSSGGMVPLMWSSFQSSTVSNPNSQLFFGDSGLMNSPPGLQLLPPSPLQQQVNPQQMSQAMNFSSICSVPEAGLQMELEPPSIQTDHGTVNASSLSTQQKTTPQIIGMKRPWPFLPEPIHLPCQSHDAMTVIGTQESNTDWLTDGAPSLCCARGNLTFDFPTEEMSVASDQFTVAPVDGGIINLRKATESKSSSIPSEARVFYNFMGLHPGDYAAERCLEGSDVVDVELKL